MPDTAAIAAAFAPARWGRFSSRDALVEWQRRRIATFVRTQVPRAAFYRSYAGAPLGDLPIVDKAKVLAEFAAFNVRGITLDRAMAVAVAAERSRDFSPTIDGLTVGLSSGTSGPRGVFLVSPEERARWAGVMLARVLSPRSLRQILSPWERPLRVAFFLRANSNLYETLGSRRVRFAFHDLHEPLDRHIARLRDDRPDILAAPPTVLRRLADAALAGTAAIAPSQVLSVAEVLEPDDARAIERAFGVTVQNIYQATEGFLGASCPAGRIHLNEDLLHVEPEWLDAERRRFRPIVTDFSRTTQLVVRYRLDDILIAAPNPCACGRATLALEAIEGRADDLLWAGGEGGGRRAIFPDVLRRAMSLAGEGVCDYRIEQRNATWSIQLLVDAGADLDTARARVGAELAATCRSLGATIPALTFAAWDDRPLTEKRRRIRCADHSSGAAVTA